MVVTVSRSPALAWNVNSYALPGRAGPGFSSPTGVSSTPLAITPFAFLTDAARDLGLPSSAWASRPRPRSSFPTVNTTRFEVWTIQSPGELGAGAVSPLEERNVVGVDTFSIRTWKVVLEFIFSPAAAAVVIPQAIVNSSEVRSIGILLDMCGVARRPGAQSALPDESNDIG